MTFLLEQLRLMFRILTFTATPDELEQLNWPSLIIGLPIVWLVGYGRWWDEPREISVIHRSGIGSVIYVLVLSLLLWLIAYPLRTRNLPLSKMMAFVAFTALPAALYAIPVELWMDRQTAIIANIAFLSTVSVYRVALLIWFLGRGAGHSPGNAWLCGFLPISGIAVGLTFVGFAEQIFEIMGGLRQLSPGEESFSFVTMLSCTSLYALPVLLIFYGFAIARKNREGPSDQSSS